MANSKRRKRASYITGEKGVNRVRLFVQARDEMLYVEYRDELRLKRRECLRHSDWERGKKAADSLAAALRANEAPRSEGLTLRQLFDKYVRLETPKKSLGVQLHDKRACQLFEECWGSNTKVDQLGKKHWLAFIESRKAGTLRPPGRTKDQGKRKPRTIANRQIQYDLSFLRAVCNWATTEDESGKRLLENNPFRGLKLPAEAQPKRPLVTEDEYQKLRAKAGEVGEAVSLFLTLAHETGHRASAIRQLRWSDFNPEAKTISWRAESDKTKFAHTVPLSDTAVEALKAAQRHSGAIGEAWVFPSATEPSEPISRQVAIKWWKKLERATELSRLPGRGWHSLRRKFATELKHADQPLVDIARLGGWKGPETLLRVYMQPDEESMRTALTKRTQLRSAAI